MLVTEHRFPSESAIRWLLGRVDPDQFNTAISRFIQRLCTGVALAGRRRVLALDGKAVRGARHTDRNGTEVAGRHLLAVIDQHTWVALGQISVDAKDSEIRRLAPLLDTLTGIDLAGGAHRRCVTQLRCAEARR